MDRSIFGGAEAAIAAAWYRGRDSDILTRGSSDADSREVISILSTGSQQGINKTCGSLICRSAVAAAQRGQCGRKTDGWIITVVSDHHRIDGAQRTYGGGFIGGDTRLQQIWDRDGRDDKNNRNNDE